ncbi:MAG: glycoside hydrolase family 43 protein [Acutalibacteraceae bacterium]|nr:glycoside hydrolase family 43 protein [Acutalibacteraceae bacterium]
MPYIFAHFKEKITSDGEQVYFAVSPDGYNWEQLNGGNPVLESKISMKGCRDIELVRLKKGGFVILTTDESISYRLDDELKVDWSIVNKTGSHGFCFWRSDDLINFSEQKILPLGRDDFGCMWAPEVFYDETEEEYLIHWGSTVKQDNYTHMSIYYSTTKDFESFTKPRLFFTKSNEILDTHIKKIDGIYHLFYKNAHNPGMNMHAVSENLYGPYIHDEEFQKLMTELPNPGCYEAATTYILPDGRWCLMLDFFGCPRPEMGYVPFVSEKAGDCNFRMCKEEFSFPYGFKHGNILEITDEEYERLKKHYK